MKNKAKVVYCSWGSGIALGVAGTKSDVAKKCNQFFNYNATDSEPIWQNENEQHAFAYVLTNWDRLHKAYADMFVAGFLTDRKMSRKRFKGGFIRLAQLKAKQRCEEIKMEHFLSDRNQVEAYTQSNPHKTLSRESLPNSYTED